MKLRLETVRAITTEIHGSTDFNSDDYTAFIGKTDDEIVNLIRSMDLVTMMNLETKEVLEETYDKRLKCLKDKMNYELSDSDGRIEYLDTFEKYEDEIEEVEDRNWGVKILTDMDVPPYLK